MDRSPGHFDMKSSDILPLTPESSMSNKISSSEQGVEKQCQPTISPPVPATRNKKSQKIITTTSQALQTPFLIGTFNDSKTNYSQIVKQK